MLQIIHTVFIWNALPKTCNMQPLRKLRHLTFHDIYSVLSITSSIKLNHKTYK